MLSVQDSGGDISPLSLPAAVESSTLQVNQ